MMNWDKLIDYVPALIVGAACLEAIVGGIEVATNTELIWNPFVDESEPSDLKRFVGVLVAAGGAGVFVRMVVKLRQAQKESKEDDQFFVH